MIIHRTILPGQPGTKKWIEKYGQKLVCVRYKYDEARRKRITTVEMIVDEKSWNADQRRIPKNKIMSIRVDYGEINTARVVRAAGGKWNRKKRVWELPYKDVLALGLTNRLVK